MEKENFWPLAFKSMIGRHLLFAKKTFLCPNVFFSIERLILLLPERKSLSLSPRIFFMNRKIYLLFAQKRLSLSPNSFLRKRKTSLAFCLQINNWAPFAQKSLSLPPGIFFFGKRQIFLGTCLQANDWAPFVKKVFLCPGEFFSRERVILLWPERKSLSLSLCLPKG